MISLPADVPGVVANWGHRIDCQPRPGGLLHPKCSLPLQKRALLAAAMGGVALTIALANSWLYSAREARTTEEKNG